MTEGGSFIIKHNIKNIPIYLALLILVLSIILMSMNLNIKYLWYDEAGQFWISQGLNHDSDALEMTKGLSSVIKNNSQYNLDPGGFSVILHFWSMVSKNVIWLRLLPFIFNIGIIAMFVVISYKFSNNLFISIIVGFLALLNPILIKMSVELRAYSMEVLGVLLGVYALEKIDKDNLSTKKLLVWSCILSIFMTTRYSIIVVYFIISAYILLIILFSNQTIKRKIINISVYSIPLFLTLAFIYFFSLRHQNPSISTLSYLPYLSDDYHILFRSINIRYLVLVMFIGILIILMNVKIFNALKKYKKLFIVTVIVNIFFIILSFLGKHPWNPYSSRCLIFTTLTILSLCAVVIEIGRLFLERPKLKKLFIVGATVLMIVIFAGLSYKGHFTLGNKANTYHELKSMDVQEYDNIFVDRWESPCIRYLCEYGALKDDFADVYPDNFTFEKYIKHTYDKENIEYRENELARMKMDDLTDYDLVIAPELASFSHFEAFELLDGTTKFYVRSNTSN